MLDQIQCKARRDGSVGTAASNRVATSGLSSLQARQTVSSACRSNRLWVPTNIIFNGCRSSFKALRRPGREVNYSPPFSVEVKMSGAIPPAECLRGVNSEGFTFTFT